ncbi:methionine adenosyltransferase 2 subunit beta-like isoform X2 [Portunus trituberculatus]|uniref:methionine adenosyltransferase 2 subunit beta-like isoform X2 n=1 Tax=Portunus trituberculatus TaxID=210409 RepID=UPI001E1D0A4C|nr:methionine adenosyltransferase 2 subunit beta-like isoform X2 [Portunus trituberculatus]
MCNPPCCVLVTGASGLLGRAVCGVLREAGHAVKGLAFSRAGPGLIKCDLTDLEAVRLIIEKEKPNFIIHTAAQRFPDVVESQYEETRILNIRTAENIASVANQIKCKMIHISTDYVFDGTSPPYKVGDKCNPLSKYGLTKLESEEAVLAAAPDVCVLRVPVLYGPVERLEESAVTCLLNILKSSEPKAVSHHDQRCPAHGQNLSGIYQWSGREKLTKYEMTLKMALVFSLPHSHVTPSMDASPLRPHDPEMDVSRLTELGISHHTKFEEAIKECLASWV